MRSEPAFPEVPIMCLSGLTDAAERAKRLCVPCLTKPVDAEALIRAVLQHCPFA